MSHFLHKVLLIVLLFVSIGTIYAKNTLFVINQNYAVLFVLQVV